MRQKNWPLLLCRCVKYAFDIFFFSAINFSFRNVIVNTRFFRFVCRSNTDEKAPVFELVPGRTEQSNKLNTFRLESEGNTAHIRLSRHMDYESISEYVLNVRIQVRWTRSRFRAVICSDDHIPLYTVLGRRRIFVWFLDGFYEKSSYLLWTLIKYRRTVPNNNNNVFDEVLNDLEPKGIFR